MNNSKFFVSDEDGLALVLLTDDDLENEHKKLDDIYGYGKSVPKEVLREDFERDLMRYTKVHSEAERRKRLRGYQAPVEGPVWEPEPVMFASPEDFKVCSVCGATWDIEEEGFLWECPTCKDVFCTMDCESKHKCRSPSKVLKKPGATNPKHRHREVS